MGDYVIRVLLATLFATMVCHGGAQAFYVEGLMSGMSSTTVEKILLKRGYEITDIRENGGLVARSSQENGQIVETYFCDDRLMQVRIDFEPKFSRFVELVEMKRKELGVPGSVQVIPAASGSKIADNAILFSWLDEATTIEVVYAEKTLSPRVSMFHRVKSFCQ